jgi:opacity protein-like surface antigen
MDSSSAGGSELIEQGGETMKSMRAVAISFVVLSALVCAALVVAQEQRMAPPIAARQQAVETGRNSNAVGMNVVKTIVTAEVDYNTQRGSFASWHDLYSAPELQKYWQPLHLSAGPEVVPGWTLSLVAAADGQSFQLSVRNLGDPCRLSFFSDENGIIYEGGSLNCSVQLVPGEN